MVPRSARPTTALIAALVSALTVTTLLAEPDGMPAVPAWLFDITRVAYTDLGNRNPSRDWPDMMIPDLADAGVQMLFSRGHSGDGWQGLGWYSKFGAPDPIMQGTPVDWQASQGCYSFMEDSHSGKRCLRLVHSAKRKETYMNRDWTYRGGEQGCMLAQRKGTVRFWYKVLNAEDAEIWLGAISISKDGLENTGADRAGAVVPTEHVGDGTWHNVTVSYDFTEFPKAAWVHTSCFIKGGSADVLIDDVELVGVTPQPVTNGGFEEVEGARDGTRHVTELCHKHGMRYITYYLAQREPDNLGEEHPDWKCIDNKGKPTRYYCMNNPDYRELVRNRSVELVRDVGVDGVFFDMFHARGHECYCPACKVQFRALTGEDPPLEEDFDSVLWQRWLDFRYRSMEDAMVEINRAVKAAKPGAAIIINTWNAWVYGNKHNARNSIRMAEAVDALLEETGWYDVVDASFFAFPARHNFMNWHLAGLSRGKRAFMWASPSTFPGWRQMAEHEARIRAMTMMTNGAVPALSAPGRDVVRSYISDIAQREAFFKGSSLYPWCGLVVSEKTELWYGRDEKRDRYVKGVYGAFQTMLERHLPVSLVTDRDLELGTLEPYKVLFMPNCAVMSEKEMQTVRDFVKNGGGLVTTYETSFYDEHAVRRDTFGLADVLKATPQGTFDTQIMRSGWNPRRVHAASMHMEPDHRWSSDAIIGETLQTRSVTAPIDSIDRRIPLHCRMLLVDPDGVEPSPLRLTTAHYNRETKAVDRTSHTAVIESTFGKGRVIYFPADMSWSFFRYGHEWLARIMELALRDAASAPPPVEVEAPTIVQTMTHVQGNRLVVHLLNDISSTGRSQNVQGRTLYSRRETIPIHDIRITFRNSKLSRFRLIPGDTPLAASKTADGLQVTVPKLDIHCMVVAE